MPRDLRELAGLRSGHVLKEGGLARHVMGGPVMVVFSIQDDCAYCRWRIGRELRSGTYHLTELEPISLPSD